MTPECVSIAEGLAADALAAHGFYWRDEGSRAPEVAGGPGPGNPLVFHTCIFYTSIIINYASFIVSVKCIFAHKFCISAFNLLQAHRPRLQWLRQHLGCPTRVLDIGACFGIPPLFFFFFCG